MNSLFHNLDPVKKQRIINAAFEEFMQSGYTKASTNEIVKKAQISKGSLFNYFTSKKDLYVYLIEHSVQIIEKIYEHIDLNERDIFRRLEKIGLYKLHLQKRYPKIFDFLISLKLEESEEVRKEISNRIDTIQEQGVSKIYENIDYSMFREDIDIQKAIEIMNWTMFGFGEKAISQLDTFELVGEEYLKEWESYSNILKSSFYK